MKSLAAWASLVVCALAATGCAEGPFVTTVPKERPPADAAGEVVSVCYNANATTREAIYAVAEKECVKELDKRKMAFDHLELWRHDTAFNECPIFSKTRVSFFCRPPATR